MVFTPQKPTQRTRHGERPGGLPGSLVERGRRGEKRQELGRPVRFLRREGSVARHTDREPRKGQPGHGRRLEPPRHEQPPQPVSHAEQQRGAPKTPRESEPPILLRAGRTAHRGELRSVPSK
jgi:hypothetical protein